MKNNMKKYRLCIMMMVVLVLIGLFTGCGKDDQQTETNATIQTFTTAEETIIPVTQKPMESQNVTEYSTQTEVQESIKISREIYVIVDLSDPDFVPVAKRCYNNLKSKGIIDSNSIVYTIGGTMQGATMKKAASPSRLINEICQDPFYEISEEVINFIIISNLSNANLMARDATFKVGTTVVVCAQKDKLQEKGFDDIRWQLEEKAIDEDTDKTVGGTIKLYAID